MIIPKGTRGDVIYDWSAHFYILSALILTVNIHLERLIGRGRDSIIRDTPIRSHVNAVHFRNVQRVSWHRCGFPGAVGYCLLVLSHPFDSRLWESVCGAAEPQVVALANNNRAWLIRAVFGSWRNSWSVKWAWVESWLTTYLRSRAESAFHSRTFRSPSLSTSWCRGCREFHLCRACRCVLEGQSSLWVKIPSGSRKSMKTFHRRPIHGVMWRFLFIVWGGREIDAFNGLAGLPFSTHPKDRNR